jgi:MYXO-CTERM domain-containing protein
MASISGLFSIVAIVMFASTGESVWLRFFLMSLLLVPVMLLTEDVQRYDRVLYGVGYLLAGVVLVIAVPAALGYAGDIAAADSPWWDVAIGLLALLSFVAAFWHRRRERTTRSLRMAQFPNDRDRRH